MTPSTNESGTDMLPINVLDRLAETKPYASYAYYPVSPSGYEDGFAKLTYRQFANVVNGLAWWMTAQLGRSTSFNTITYVGPNDFMQNAMILASAKVGYQLLLASPRNQKVALTSLLEDADCKALLTTDLESPIAKSMQEVYPMKAFQLPSASTLIAERFPHYPYLKTFEEAKEDPLVILHTSGTTGVPKPIKYTNGWAVSYMGSLSIEPYSGDTDWELKDLVFRRTRLFVMMPPFHAANIFCTSFSALASETTIIFPPSGLPPTLEVFLGGIQAIQVDTAFVPPHFVAQIATQGDALNITKKHLYTLISGGGKIAERHGNIVSSQVRLLTFYGATEVGSIPDLTPTGLKAHQTWNYIKPHFSAGWQFRFHEEVEDEKVYEAWIVKTHDEEMNQPIFSLYPERTEYQTRDLFKPHPKMPGMWKWVGRIDDTISLATGANVSPVSMEEGLSQHAAIQGVLMVGTGYSRPALIVETSPSISEEDWSEAIWAEVERLNDHYFVDHRIRRSHILFTNSSMPMARSLKGTVQRTGTVKLYDAALKKLETMIEFNGPA